MICTHPLTDEDRQSSCPSCAYAAGVRAERERAAAICDDVARRQSGKDRKAGMVAAASCAWRIRQGAPTPARPAQEPARQGEAQRWGVWVTKTGEAGNWLLKTWPGSDIWEGASESEATREIVEYRRTGEANPEYRYEPRPLQPAAKEKA